MLAQLSCWTTSDIRHTLMGIKVRADIRVGVLLRVFPCEDTENTTANKHNVAGRKRIAPRKR